MMGEITAGFCLREYDLWYGSDKHPGPCRIPLSDGKACSDNYNCRENRDMSKDRCPYSSGLKVDMTGQKHVTYAYLNDRKPSPGVMATGGSAKGGKG